MHMGLDLAPESTEAGIGRVDVLDHREARQGLGGDVLVIAEADAVGAVAVARMRLARANERSAGKGDDRLHVGEAGNERPAGEADRAPRRDDDLQCVADGRRVVGA